MADDRSKRGAADRDRINMNEDYEVRYWTHKWKVSPDALAAAVHEVGVMVRDVAEKLGKVAYAKGFAVTLPGGKINRGRNVGQKAAATRKSHTELLRVSPTFGLP
jgi:hypothetical protein